MSKRATHVEEAIDNHWAVTQDDGLRKHLGASLIGRECDRELWYSFRWVSGPGAHKGRILRLWNRGHLEEFRFVEYLRSLGVEVQDYSQRLMYHDGSDSYVCIDWDDEDHHAWVECDDVSDSAFHIQRATARKQGPTQWRIQDVDGHFGGSSDGRALNLSGLLPKEYPPETKVLLEFKTHNDASFKKLVTAGVRASKPEHFVQMQTYMHKMGLKLALYMAVNKNTDELYAEFVPLDEAVAIASLSKARDVIRAESPPPKISMNPGWFKCRFCDHSAVCHQGEPFHKSCRSCMYSAPVENGAWRCSLHGDIPDEFVKLGCDGYRAIENK